MSRFLKPNPFFFNHIYLSSVHIIEKFVLMKKLYFMYFQEIII